MHRTEQRKEVRKLSFDIHGEFITQIAREWFYSGEKDFDKIMEILMDSMTGTDTPEAQIRRYAEDILIGRAALKGSTAAGTYHLEIYEPGEEEQMMGNMNIWKQAVMRKNAENFLYDYYMERKCEREANAIWQDE